jgi:hypothetical protein
VSLEIWRDGKKIAETDSLIKVNVEQLYVKYNWSELKETVHFPFDARRKKGLCEYGSARGNVGEAIVGGERVHRFTVTCINPVHGWTLLRGVENCTMGPATSLMDMVRGVFDDAVELG